MNWKSIAYRSIWQGLDLIFPPFCGGCSKKGNSWCFECQQKTQEITGNICDICGVRNISSKICVNCQNHRPSYSKLRSWAVFEGSVRNALHRLKYKRDISLGNTLAWQMLGFAQSLSWNIDILIPIPLGIKRLKERGYNQSATIAFPLALDLEVRYAPKMLSRIKETRSQVELSTRIERYENTLDAFKSSSDVLGRTVLIFDDVATTGATMSSAAAALLSAGAKDVYALSVARAMGH